MKPNEGSIFPMEAIVIATEEQLDSIAIGGLKPGDRVCVKSSARAGIHWECVDFYGRRWAIDVPYLQFIHPSSNGSDKEDT